MARGRVYHGTYVGTTTTWYSVSVLAETREQALELGRGIIEARMEEHERGNIGNSVYWRTTQEPAV